MVKSAFRLLPVFVLYLLLTAGSGPVLGLWAASELALGAALSVVIAAASSVHLKEEASSQALNPLRWLMALGYVLGPFLLEMAKANIDVAYRVITGKINPGIIRVKTGMKSELGTLLLANSITLTPGTLTVDIDETSGDLFIHKIQLSPEEAARCDWQARELFSANCPAMLRRIAE